MKSLPVILGMLLAVSLLFNVVAFVRLGEDPPAVAPARTPEARRAVPAERPAEIAPVAAAPERPASPGVEAAPAPVVPSAGKAPAPLSLTTPSLRNDPKVREVLQANESFNAFWKDLDKVYKVRNKFDEAKYTQAVMTATTDFLELGDPNRAQFEEAARVAAGSYAQVRREHDAARAALPQKDKSNPTSLAAYEQQKDAIDLRTQSQVKSVVDTLRPYLNASDARHQEFLQNADKWLRNLAPKPAKN